MPKHHTSLRLAEHTRQQLLALAERMGMSQAEIVGVALERLAREKYAAWRMGIGNDYDPAAAADGDYFQSFDEWIAASQPDHD